MPLRAVPKATYIRVVHVFRNLFPSLVLNAYETHRLGLLWNVVADVLEALLLLLFERTHFSHMVHSSLVSTLRFYVASPDLSDRLALIRE